LNATDNPSAAFDEQDITSQVHIDADRDCHPRHADVDGRLALRSGRSRYFSTGSVATLWCRTALSDYFCGATQGRGVMQRVQDRVEAIENKLAEMNERVSKLWTDFQERRNAEDAEMEIYRQADRARTEREA
jgi:hypothetical protein